MAVAVNQEGYREVLGLSVGPAESEAVWTEFLRSLVRRGLQGMELVTADAQECLKRAIAAVLGGAGWQRCRVHFMRNVLSQVPKADQSAASATIRTASNTGREVADRLRANFAKATECMDNA